MATIRALDGTVDLTAGGTITVDSEGKTAAYTEFSGNIDFNGKTVISGAGIGAWSTTDSKIGMNPYGEETSKITFNDFVTMDPVNIGAKAQYNGDIIFNKGFAIDAEENAFYADSAGRIQALATGEDKVIKGNMLLVMVKSMSSLTRPIHLLPVRRKCRMLKQYTLLRTKKITAMTKSMVMKKRRMMMNM